MKRWLTVGSILVLWLLSAPGCEPLRPRPHLVAYLLDAARADFFGVYGQRDSVTPNMDGMAREGTWFASHYANSFYTRASVSQLFSGRYEMFDILQGFDDEGRMIPSPPRDQLILPDAILLSDLLRMAGYRTVLVTSHVFLTSGSPFGSSFDEVVQLDPSEAVVGYVAADRVLDEARRKAQAHQEAHRGVPLFLYVHLMDTHTPHHPPAGFDRFEAVPPHLETDEARTLARRAKGSMAFADDEIGRFRADLPSLLDGDLVEMITSDHGDCYGEGGCLGHGVCALAREEAHRIPLILSGRDVPVAVVDSWSSTVDVLPTLADLLDLPLPDSVRVDGRSLVPMMAGGAGHLPGVLYVNGAQTGFRTSSGSFRTDTDDVRITRPGDAHFEPAGHISELSTLIPDPLVRLRSDYLRRWAAYKEFEKLAEEQAGLPSEERLEQLKALGYVQ